MENNYFSVACVEKNFENLRKKYIGLKWHKVDLTETNHCGYLCKRGDGGWMLNIAEEPDDKSGLRNIPLDRILMVRYNGKDNYPKGAKIEQTEEETAKKLKEERIAKLQAELNKLMEEV